MDAIQSPVPKFFLIQAISLLIALPWHHESIACPIIGPAIIYVLFRATSMVRIKTRLAGNGYPHCQAPQCRNAPCLLPPTDFLSGKWVSYAPLQTALSKLAAGVLQRHFDALLQTHTRQMRDTLMVAGSIIIYRYSSLSPRILSANREPGEKTLVTASIPRQPLGLMD